MFEVIVSSSVPISIEFSSGIMSSIILILLAAKCFGPDDDGNADAAAADGDGISDLKCD